MQYRERTWGRETKGDLQGMSDISVRWKVAHRKPLGAGQQQDPAQNHKSEALCRACAFNHLVKGKKQDSPLLNNNI